MPITLRIQQGEAYTSPLYYAPGEPVRVLEGLQATNLNGALMQLGWLANYAKEMFSELSQEANTTIERMHAVSMRASRLRSSLPTVENTLYTDTNSHAFFNTPGIEHRAVLTEQDNLFARDSDILPAVLRDSYLNCQAPPALHRMDRFVKDGESSCLRKYTDPQFFRMQWIQAMQEQREKAIADRRARREKRRAERQRRKKPAEEAQTKQKRKVCNTIVIFCCVCINLSRLLGGSDSEESIQFLGS